MDLFLITLFTDFLYYKPSEVFEFSVYGISGYKSEYP